MTQHNHRFYWTGRQDPEDGEYAKRWHQIIKEKSTKDILMALVGFACDEGVKRNKGRVGAKNAPDTIRSALTNLAWHGKQGYIYDYSNIYPIKKNSEDILETAQKILGNTVKTCLEKYRNTLVLGGGHETAFGSFLGLLEYLKTIDQTHKKIGIIKF